MRSREFRGLVTVAIFFAGGFALPAFATCPGDCPVRGGGRPTADCLAEYFGLVDAPAAGSSRAIRCQDGAACDRDGTVNNSCTFNVQVCLNQDDPALTQCTAKGVDSFTIRTRDTDLLALQDKVRALLPSSESVCSEVQPITVALGGSPNHPRPRGRLIRSLTSGTGGTDLDQISLACLPPPRPLGRRHFSINPDTSPLLAVLGSSFSIPIVPGFQGFIDFEAGVPDPATGVAQIDIVDASDFIFADTRPLGPLICLRPIFPDPPMERRITGAGVIACKGHQDYGYSVSINHNIGTVGVNGFTAVDCTSVGGTVEDGSAAHPHTNVCNGPFVFGQSGGADSGLGAVAIAPVPEFGLQGFPVEISFGSMDDADCSTAPPGDVAAIAFVSGPTTGTITNFKNQPGTLTFRLNSQSEPFGTQNFSCGGWTTEDGPGRLTFLIPQLDVPLSGTYNDIITAFVLSDR
jgi:hypothetical protein